MSYTSLNDSGSLTCGNLTSSGSVTCQSLNCTSLVDTGPVICAGIQSSGNIVTSGSIKYGPRWTSGWTWITFTAPDPFTAGAWKGTQFTHNLNITFPNVPVIRIFTALDTPSASTPPVLGTSSIIELGVVNMIFQGSNQVIHKDANNIIVLWSQTKYCGAGPLFTKWLTDPWNTYNQNYKLQNNWYYVAAY